MSLFQPRNRHLLIEPVPIEEEEKPFLLPEDYRPLLPRFTVAKLLRQSPDCASIFRTGDIRLVVVNSSMIEEIEIQGVTYHVVLENHVIGTFT
tara:strand:- start:335 stop:613 length:279 start_codon:yes stop_codon:yes gene_type:complete